MISSKILVSFVISTHNRRDVLLNTLQQLNRCGLAADSFETFVVDNASHDSTAEAVGRWFPNIRVFVQQENLGPVAKNIGIDHALGRYVVFLDDDSFPQPGSIRRMIQHFESDARLGAAVFNITLPDGSQECSAYPNVFIGCGTGFRRRALQQVGGLPTDFFMAAEEYDLSLRLLAAGWEVRRFEDLYVTHLKTSGTRFPERITELDVRNNLLLIARHFPRPWALSYAADWSYRYYLIAASKGHLLPWLRGMSGGAWAAMRTKARRPLDLRTFEKFSKIQETRRRLQEVQQRFGLNRILLLDFGKNMLAYYLAAKTCGLEIVAVADAKLGSPGRRYRDIPLIKDGAASRMKWDAAIVSNLSPVHAAQRYSSWLAQTDRPVIDLFAGRDASEQLNPRMLAA